MGIADNDFAMFSDGGGARFYHSATLTVPRALHLLEQPGEEGASTHLCVDVLAPFFAEHQDWTHQVTLALDGEPLDKRLFRSWYCRHQFLVPLTLFRGEQHLLTLTATPIETGAPAGEEPCFAASVFVTSKPRIWDTFERRAIWLFSTARSGSTWLASDVIGKFGETRLIDESGLGRMFAPLQWDAERFFADRGRDHYIASDWQCGSGTEKDRPSMLPVFERSFVNLQQENQILSHHNYDLYHRMLRDMAFEQAFNEWGMRDYSLLIFKMPNDSHAADLIMRACPQSNLVFLMRDGRDVMRSRFSPFASSELAATTNRDLRRHAIWFYSHFWNFQVDIIRAAFEAHAPERSILVRYEELRTDPVKVTARLYDHLKSSLPAECVNAMTRDELSRLAEASRLENVPEGERGPDMPRQYGIVGGYRSAFDDEEIALMNAIMGPNLARYGYDLAEPPIRASTSRTPDPGNRGAVWRSTF